jgi:hypothetical protein
MPAITQGLLLLLGSLTGSVGASTCSDTLDSSLVFS